MADTVLVNRDTKKSELIADSDYNNAIKNTHDVPLIDQDGNYVAAPFEDAGTMVSSGTHRQPTVAEMQDSLDYAKYDTPTEKLKALTEGALSANTFGASTAAEVATGISTPENIGKRRYYDEGWNTTGQVLGLVGGSLVLPGEGAAGAITALGKGLEGAAFGNTAAELTKAAEVAGNTVPGLGFLARGARAAVRSVPEGMAIQAGDELSKQFETNPGGIQQSAAMNIGLAGVLAPLFGIGAEVAHTGIKGLEAVMAGMREGEGTGLSKAFGPALQKEFPAQMNVIEGGDFIKRQHQITLNDGSIIGENYANENRELGKKFAAQVAESIPKEISPEGEVIGHSLESIKATKDLNENEMGRKVAKGISENLTSKMEPIEAAYDAFEKPAEKIPLYPAVREQIYNNLAQLADEEGWLKRPSSPEFKALKELQNELPLQENLNDLKDMMQSVNGKTGGFMNPGEVRRAGQKMNGVLDEAIGEQSRLYTGEKNPELLDKYKEARQLYKTEKIKVQELADLVHIGKMASPTAAAKMIEKADPEKVVNSLIKNKFADSIEFVKSNFPEISENMRQFNLEKLLRNVTKNKEFSVPSLVKEGDKLSPQMQEWLFNGRYPQIRAAAESIKSLPGLDNPGTYRAAARDSGGIFSKILGGGLALSGHPYIAAMAGLGSKFFSQEVPAAARVSFMRFMKNGKLPINGMAMDAVNTSIAHASRGIDLIDKAVKPILAGKMAEAITPISERDKSRIEKSAKMFSDDPMRFTDLTKHLSAYEPDHANEKIAMIARAMKVANDAKPKTAGVGVLDKDIKPTKIQLSEYNKVLGVLQDPMVALKRVGNGTLSPIELSTLKTVMPQLHWIMAEKLTHQMIDMKAKGHQVPYKQRLSVSMFIGQPLDSTMNAQSIAMNQPKPEQAPHGSAKSTKSLGGMPGMYQTREQSREAKVAQR